MRREPKRTPMDELCFAAQHAGWWVELSTARSHRNATPRLVRLLVRERANPTSVRYIHLRASTPTAIDAAAAQLTQTLLEAA